MGLRASTPIPDVDSEDLPRSVKEARPTLRIFDDSGFETTPVLLARPSVHVATQAVQRLREAAKLVARAVLGVGPAIGEVAVAQKHRKTLRKIPLPETCDPVVDVAKRVVPSRTAAAASAINASITSPAG
jgi:hypothetical protein